ncbi:MAG: hemolysin [Proteobacteria bacterium]|nr:MAG: hemolysin [Pseudomonadota bacterium]PIE40321.1 MAG: hemolysin [Gammaproteobacteria bacterium]
MGLLIFYVSLALGVSFLCSIMEAVLLSISPSFIARHDNDDNPFGRKLKEFKKNLNEPLAAILSLNTIAHTVGAAGAGAQAAKVFGEVYIGVISAVLTFLILVVSEIIPKTLGAAYWRQLTPTVVRLLQITVFLMWPLVKMSEMLTSLITNHKGKHQIQRDEFIALTELGTKEGIFHKYESRVLHNLFYFRNIRTKDIMTPRTVMFAMSENLPVSEVLEQNPVLRFSRIPIFGENPDDIKGFVLKDDILRKGTENHRTLLKELCRTILVIPDDLALHDLFRKMMSDSNHIALVVDEYGGTQGLVTMEDFIETLLGLEIVDESDDVEDMQALARNKWNERAQKNGLFTSPDKD